MNKLGGFLIPVTIPGTSIASPVPQASIPSAAGCQCRGEGKVGLTYFITPNCSERSRVCPRSHSAGDLRMCWWILHPWSTRRAWPTASSPGQSLCKKGGPEALGKASSSGSHLASSHPALPPGRRITTVNGYRLSGTEKFVSCTHFIKSQASCQS